ncbi:hypothetical protein AAGS39_28120 [Flavobacterium sp. CGRL2]
MPKILLIEDDIAFCKLLEKFLIKKAYDVTIAFSAAEARTAVKNESFDLILTDLRLPDFDGIALMSEFKNSYPNIPVILMTGYSDVNTAVKAIKNGAADYISKPFNPDEVLLVITNALKSQELEDETETPVKEKKESQKNSFYRK